PRRRDQQGRDRAGRGEERADEEAREEAAHAAPRARARAHSGRALRLPSRAQGGGPHLHLRGKRRPRGDRGAARGARRLRHPVQGPADHAELARGHLRDAARREEERVNVYAIRAIYNFEMARARRTLMQSLISPVISTALYFVVFGAAIGGRIPQVEGVSY